MNTIGQQIESYHQDLDKALVSRIEFECRRQNGGLISKEYLSAVIDVVEKIRIVAHGIARKHGANYGPTSLVLEPVESPSDLSTRRDIQSE